MRAPVRRLVLFATLSAACAGPTVDLSKGLQILDISSGWVDEGVVNGLNKLSPSISFKLKNVSDQTLGSLQANVLFRRVTEKDEWGSGFVTAAGSDGLAPGATSMMVVITSPHGYTGTEARLDILKNSQFVDAKAEVFAKYGALQWTRLGEFPIARQLIAK